MQRFAGGHCCGVPDLEQHDLRTEFEHFPRSLNIRRIQAKLITTKSRNDSSPGIELSVEHEGPAYDLNLD